MSKKEPNNLDLQVSNALNALKLKVKTPEKKTKDDIFWFGPPVSPKEFIESNKYFGNSTSKRVYPWVIDTMEEIFTREYYLPNYQTAVILCGKGSGKSYMAGMIDAYLCYLIMSFKDITEYLHKKYGISKLDRSMTITLLGMAPTKDQAKHIVYDSTKKFIYDNRFLREKGWLPDPQVTNELRFLAEDPETHQIYTKVRVMPGNSSDTVMLGYGLFGGVIDEACFFAEKNHDPVEEIYGEFNYRRFSRFGNNGLVSLISSATSSDVYAEKLAEMSFTDNSIYLTRKAMYDCKPEYFHVPRFELKVPHEQPDGTTKVITINPPEILKPLYEKDLNTTLRDVNSIPALVGRPFYGDWLLFETKVNRDRQDPCPDLGLDVAESAKDVKDRLGNFSGIPGCKYRIHVDLSKGATVKGQCGCGFAMSHKIMENVSFKIKLDLAVRFKASAASEVDINEILNLIKWLKESRGFNIDLVTFDKWNSMYPIQVINSWNNGITAVEQSVGYKEHKYLKNLIFTGEFDFYEDKNLFFELKRLCDYETEVLPGVGATKDEADAVAGSVNAVAALDAEIEAKPLPRATHFVPVHKVSGPRSSVPSGQYRKIGGPKPFNRGQFGSNY